MKKHVLASMLAATTLSVLTPLTSHAFGLGKISVMSALNEPFNAEIDVTALRPDEKDNLQAKMASDAEFSKAGLDRSFLLNQMQFDIVQRDGQTKILITSKQPIKEPFMDFLVVASAGAGVMMREYTVLLDPPEFVLAETRPAPVQPKSAPPAAKETNTTRYEYSESSSYSGSSYKVQRNDTLWNIALKTRPDDAISVHQMMMSLFNRNPDAFSNNNVNGLKAGVTLQIPGRDEMQALSPSAARQAFAEQTEAWKNRNRPAVTPVVDVAVEPATPTTPEATETEFTSSESLHSTDESTETLMPQAESKLDLVASDDNEASLDEASPNTTGDDQLQTLTEQLTLAQETIEAQVQENIDLQDRMALLEEQIETMRRMLSVEDTDLARMQAMLEEGESTSSDQSELAQDTDTSEQEAASTTDATDVAAEQATQPQQSAEPEAAEDVVTSVAETLNLNPAEVQSTIDKVKQFVAENKLPVALGLLVLLLVLWLIARRNREVTWDEAVKKLDKEAPTDVVPAAVAVEVVDEDETTDAPATSDQAAEEKTAAELVEQADMFVGYADYVQAKSSLEQARMIEPDNTLVAYKTLFVLYKLNQADEFVELAEASQFEPDSFEWSEIKNWGQQLVPGHELFSEPTVEPEVADNEEPAVTTDEISESVDMEQAAEDTSEQVEEASGPIEFDLNDFAEKAENTEPVEEKAEEPVPSKEAVDDDLLSFDTNFTGSTNDEAVEAVDIDAVDIEDDVNLAFDEDTKPASVAPVSAEEDTIEEEDAPDLEFDIGDLDEIDEAETKLDLAAAYIDMGDPEGARSILNEVLIEGNDDQKNRAQTLLDSIE